MLPMNPHMVHLQKLAVATWFEQDETVAKFIFTSLKSLAHIKITDVPAASRMVRLVEKAATVLPLEFAVQVGGVKNVVLETVRALSATSANVVHADLLKIIRQLEITPQAEEALETFFWGRSNDIQIAFAAPVL